MESITKFNKGMRRFYILMLILLAGVTARAQYVPIDSNFRKWFVSTGHSECVTGNLLDTTCAGLDSITYVNCIYFNANSLNGIQYMHNLRDLITEYSLFTSLPPLPSSLKFLDCSYPIYEPFNLPALPAGLDSLQCVGCQIPTLPSLPSGLTYLNAAANPFTSISSLPASLVHLDLSGNFLTSLPFLPASLKYMDVSYGRLNSLPSLPTALVDLIVNSNQLTALPSLPPNLVYLDCSNNQLTALPALPTAMLSIGCDHNLLTTLPTLPDTMQSIFCGYNPITSFPALPRYLNQFECDSIFAPIPTLSQNLYYLDCQYCNLTSLPASTPHDMAVLMCAHNQLTSIAPVTKSGQLLDCSYNLITSINYANDGSYGSGPGYSTIFPVFNCSHNKLTSVTLNVIPPNNLFTYPSGAVLGDFNCSNNPTLECFTYLPTMETFEFDSTGITCLPNIPWIVDSSSPSIIHLSLCDTGNASGCPAYHFYVSLGKTIQANCSGAGVYLSDTVYSGYPPYSYQWYPATGLSSTTIANPIATPSSSTWYYLTVTDSIGNQSTDSVYVVNDTLITGAPVITNSGCSGNVTATVCIPTSGGLTPYLYEWYLADTFYRSSSACLAGLDSGSYYVNVVDSLGCGSYPLITVSKFTIDSVAVSYNCHTGIGYATVAVQGGSTPLSYLWSNGDTLVSDTGLIPGTYSVTVTDGGGCSASAIVTLSPPASSTLVFDSIKPYSPRCVNEIGGCCAYPGGGVEPYKYAWSNGYNYNQQCINGFYPNSYVVSVTDSVGCMIDTGFLITPAVPFTDTVTITGGNCQTPTTACAQAAGGTPPYYYYWSSGQRDSTCITNLSPGGYNVTVYDNYGCSAFFAFHTTTTSPIIIDSAVTQSFPCSYDTSSSICLITSGGTTPFTYLWSTAATTACLTAAGPGSYSVTVQDIAGCSATAVANVTPPPAALSVSSQITGYCPDNLGQICLTVSGGTTGYSYSWAYSAYAGWCPYNLLPGTYRYTVTDAHNCILVDSATVAALAPVTLTIAAPDTNAVPDSVSVTPGGSNIVYYVSWGDGALDTTTVGSAISHIYQNSGFYNMSVSDSANCTAYFLFDAGCTDQCVWPGDANYDGIVNNLDLLSIGLAYDSLGTARTNPTINFIPQYCSNWADTLPGGVNYKHADCNGDGTVNADDTLAIIQNYSLTHPRGIAQSQAGGAMIYPEVVQDTVYNGDTLSVQIVLGSASNPARLVYGVAFTLNYDPSVVDTSSVQMHFNNSWMGASGDKINIAKNISASGSLECALTRIDHMTKSGEGSIGTAIFVITTDNLNGKNYAYFSAHFYISDVTLIDSAGNLLPVTPGQDTVLIGYLPTDIKPIKPVANVVSVHPNPASNTVYILSGNLPVKSIVLYDMLGNEVKRTEPSTTGTLQTVDISLLAPGGYTVQVQTSAGITVQKLVVER